jgi:energy-coupling factor transporter ATP-binding protein EcfA2
MKLSSQSAPDTQKVLVTGLSGSGKSTLVSKLAETHHLHWIDLERGAATLRKLSPEAQANIDLYSIPDSSSFPIAADTMTKLMKLGKFNICHAHGKDNCAICKKDKPDTFDALDLSTLTSNDIVVIDTVTQLSLSILAHVTRAEAMDYKLQTDDWGALRKMTEFFCSQFQAATYNLVCIAHTQEAKLEDGRVKLVPSFGSASMSAAFGKAFDHIVYCEVKNGKHVAGSSTSYSNSILTKSRTDFQIEKLAVPSLLNIFQNSVPSGQTQGEVAVSNLKSILKGVVK